ncbi:MAG: hypothetical protein LBE35_03245 [Clostridiales bacterium]|jgi:hypothetical protein|nr:hypothetical protein [Clostridiales bacterium]
MLCRNCNGSIGPEDGVCKVCGHPVRKGAKNWPRFVKMAMVVLVLGAGVVFVVFYTQGRIDFGFLTDRGAAAAPPVEAEIPAENIPAELPDPTAPQNVETVPIVRDEETRIEILSEIYVAATVFISQFPQTPFISNTGYLFDLTNETLITVEMLSATGLIGYEHLEEPKLLLFLRPADFAPFDEVEMPNSEQMTIFVGHETITGIGLYSSFGYQEIFRENLNEILLSYMPYGGEIVRPMSAHPIFQAALGNLNQMAGQDHDVRYLAFDENFVFVTVSRVGESHQLQHYVFRRDGDEISLMLANAEGARHPAQVINHAAPNFNFELLPYFEIGRNTLRVPDDAAFILEELRAANFIGADYEPEFAAVANFHAYLVFPGNQAFLGILGNDWVFRQVSGWQEAEELLWEWAQEGLVPYSLYILRQE